MPVTSPRPSVRSPRRLLAGSAFAALLLAQLGAPAGAGAAWTTARTTTVTAAPAAPGAAALEATAGLQPTIQWEEAHAHEPDRITFRAGGRVTVPFRPRATDRWTVGGVKARALPAGRVDGAAMRRGDAPADARHRPAARRPVGRHRRASRDRIGPIDLPGRRPRAPGAGRPGRTSTRGVRVPAVLAGQQQLARIQYDKISTIAYFGIGADGAGNLQKRTTDGTITTGGRAGRVRR